MSSLTARAVDVNDVNHRLCPHGRSRVRRPRLGAAAFVRRYFPLGLRAPTGDVPRPSVRTDRVDRPAEGTAATGRPIRRHRGAGTYILYVSRDNGDAAGGGDDGRAASAERHRTAAIAAYMRAPHAHAVAGPAPAPAPADGVTPLISARASTSQTNTRHPRRQRRRRPRRRTRFQSAISHSTAVSALRIAFVFVQDPASPERSSGRGATPPIDGL
ncbi:hypothetical protein EVAR_95177_1 [Eumeta japonica]|uniref:Uncharacterized protein n=1 Tax=Eumeta variegata TaxID=151549 RepID=A0A4C1VI47_EUMVA|nr:hypothetical protein EVAR_95177_1 [Eumeta japonica]